MERIRRTKRKPRHLSTSRASHKPHSPPSTDFRRHPPTSPNDSNPRHIRHLQTQLHLRRKPTPPPPRRNRNRIPSSKQTTTFNPRPPSSGNHDIRTERKRNQHNLRGNGNRRPRRPPLGPCFSDTVRNHKPGFSGNKTGRRQEAQRYE